MKKNKELPIQVKIIRKVEEANEICSFQLDCKLGSRPGQFVMLWIPGLDEKPFSVAYEDREGVRLTIAKVGPFTAKLFGYKEGESLGLRGPYGNPFRIVSHKRVALVGGGYGTAPLTFLADTLLKKHNEIFFFTGARTEGLLIYRKTLKNKPYKSFFATDDGSYGEKGFVTKLLQKIMREEDINYIYTVGPELMMKAVVAIADDFEIGCQLSLERYMKCGFGICATCCVDPLGLRMCVEGPCITKETVNKITEFGKYHRDGAGSKVFFKAE